MEIQKLTALEAEISEILCKLGIPAGADATDVLKKIILSAVTEPNSFRMSEQYGRLGREYGITRERVRQIVCHTIGQYWNRASLKILSDHFGHAVLFRARYDGEAPNGAGKPTNGAFIEMLAANLRLKHCTEQEADR